MTNICRNLESHLAHFDKHLSNYLTCRPGLKKLARIWFDPTPTHFQSGSAFTRVSVTHNYAERTRILRGEMMSSIVGKARLLKEKKREELGGKERRVYIHGRRRPRLFLGLLRPRAFKRRSRGCRIKRIRSKPYIGHDRQNEGEVIFGPPTLFLELCSLRPLAASFEGKTRAERSWVFFKFLVSSPKV